MEALELFPSTKLEAWTAVAVVPVARPTALVHFRYQTCFSGPQPHDLDLREDHLVDAAVALVVAVAQWPGSKEPPHVGAALGMRGASPKTGRDRGRAEPGQPKWGKRR